MSAVPADRSTGLVLTAGGARGAYQAGVLKRIGEIRALRNAPIPFGIIAGASAGAINGSMIAATALDFAQGTGKLSALWSQLSVGDVIRADTRALLGNGLQLLRDLALGGVIGAGNVPSLVDAAPLRAFLQRHLPVDGIGAAIDRGALYAVALTATGYHSGKAFTFIQGQQGHPLWLKSRRVALPATLGVDHVCASAAIPLVFPPVPLTTGGTTAWFGDGALRLTTPLSPAIRLGAQRLLAIGVRCQESARALTSAELAGEGSESQPTLLRRPPLSQICGVFLNAIFLDHLDADVDHLLRMNGLVANNPVQADRRRRLPAEPMRVVTPLVISPSEDLAIVAKTFAHRMPKTIRYVMDGLGTPDAQSADLMSYLLFDSAFTRALIDIGYRDASERIAEIEAFLAPPSPPARRSKRTATA